MSITDTLSERIIDYTKELKLPGIRKNFKEESVDAGDNDISYEEFLNNLLEKEYELRLVNTWPSFREKSLEQALHVLEKTAAISGFKIIQ